MKLKSKRLFLNPKAAINEVSGLLLITWFSQEGDEFKPVFGSCPYVRTRKAAKICNEGPFTYYVVNFLLFFLPPPPYNQP